MGRAAGRGLGDLFVMEAERTRGRRILVVEDDRSARESITLLLRIERHIVTEARDGSEALDLVRRETFDLVVMDYAMPGMQGGEVARHIRCMAPALPILMVTAFSDKLCGKDMPVVDAVLGKPFAVDELRGAVARLLSRG